MSYIQLGMKLVSLCLKKQFVTPKDIANSYTIIGQEYENTYLNEMHKYNDILLKKGNLKRDKEIKILDLAGGTGYNCRVLKRIYPHAQIDLVDNSIGMISKISDDGIQVCKADMLEYLNECQKKYDIVVCSWAIIYSSPRKVVKGCYRVLKNGGILKIIVNMRSTLPEIRKIYPKLLARNVSAVKKVMFELPTPKSVRQFEAWFKDGFICCMKKTGKHEFHFNTKEEAVNFVTSTGALAGYDVMIDLHNKKMQKEMELLLKEPKITHSFVYGIYRKREEN